MRPVLPILLALVGCGDFGLVAAGGGEGAAFVAVEPQGQIRFDQASPDGRSQAEEVMLVSDGDLPVYIADVWVESSTASVFFTNEDLPFPKTLEPGASIAVTVRFAPVSAGTFHGTLVIETGTEGTLLERPLVGEGCSDPDGDGSC